MILYWGRGRCYTCHSLGGQGSAVRGPNHGQFGEKFPLPMGTRAEQRAKERAEKEGVKWAEDNDPRVTRFGSFIRKTRVDELPQLWNVLKGEMSFIGPRPERPEFIQKLEIEIPYYDLRHLVMPGITGWAQVMYPYGASVEDAKEKLQYDLFYIKNFSLLLDFVILMKTLRIILRREGR